MTDTPDEILERKAELETALEHAQERYSYFAQRRGESAAEKGRAAHRVKEIRAARQIGKATDENVDELEQYLDVCGEEHADLYAQTNDWFEGVQKLEWELLNHLRAYPDVCAEEAEVATQAACAGLLGLQDAIRDAQRLWDDARAAWAPLCRAMGVAPVRSWPLVEPEDLGGDGLAPRPVGFELKPEADAA